MKPILTVLTILALAAIIMGVRLYLRLRTLRVLYGDFDWFHCSFCGTTTCKPAGKVGLPDGWCAEAKETFCCNDHKVMYEKHGARLLDLTRNRM